MSKAPTRPMHREEGKDYVLGYMCLIDFECELGAALGGNRVFPDEKDCREHHKCSSHCGIVEVKVEATRIVQKGTPYL